MHRDARTEILARLTRLETELWSVRRELEDEEAKRSPLPDAPFQALRFVVGGDHFALEGRLAREIVRYARLTRIPGASSVVQGALNLRGDAVPVLHLSERLGLGETRIDLKTPIIVAEVHQRRIGLLVERVLDVVTLSPDALKTPFAGSSGGRYLAAVTNLDGRLLQLVDVESLATRTELEELEARLSEAPLLDVAAKSVHPGESA